MAVRFNKDEVAVTKENGVAVLKVGNENTYFDKAKENDITKDTLKKVSTFNEEYLHAAVDVVKNTAKDIMVEDSSIDKVVGTTPYSVSKRGSINVDVVRSHTYPAMNGGEPITKSVIKVDVKDPTKKMSVKTRKEWEAELTDALLK